MKAIRVYEFGEPSVLKLEEMPDPTPAAGQVVVKMEAIGVNPVETYIRRGIYGPKQFPYTPGSDGAGVVKSVGPGVTRFKASDRVYVAGSVSGTYAELALCAESAVHPLPQNLSFEQGAAIGVPYATAYRALFTRGRAQAGETVLIHGATGGVGIAAVQLARAHELKVLGTGGTDKGRELALREGAHHMFDHTRAGYEQEILKQSRDGARLELIVEMLANVNLQRDLMMLSRNGRVIVVGNRGKIEIDPRETMKREADIRGMTLMNATEPELAKTHADLIAGFEKGTLRPIVGQQFPLADAAKAHEAVMSSGAFGKIVLRP
jgi:NADPH2:quinone reductase